MASENLGGGSTDQVVDLDSLASEAKKAGYDAGQIDTIQRYATRLVDAGLPVIFDHSHLALLSGFKTHFLYSVSNNSELFYKNFYIKKRSGGIRKISEPLPDLKIIQRWLLDSLIGNLQVSKFSHAFQPGRSVKTNARFHLARKVVVKVDFADFFGSISTKAVFELLIKTGYTKNVAGIIASLCTLNGSLPQGAPTSAALSNAYLYEFDGEVGAWALEHGWRYSRYADDLAFSGTGNIDELFQKIHQASAKYDLTVNPRKSRVMRQGARQVICGVIVNERMSAPRNFLRKLRQEIHYIERFGLEVHVAKIGATRSRYAEVLRGRLAHAIWLSGHTPEKVEEIKLMGKKLETALRASHQAHA